MILVQNKFMKMMSVSNRFLKVDCVHQAFLIVLFKVRR